MLMSVLYILHLMINNCLHFVWLFSMTSVKTVVGLGLPVLAKKKSKKVFIVIKFFTHKKFQNFSYLSRTNHGNKKCNCPRIFKKSTKSLISYLLCVK